MKAVSKNKVLDSLTLCRLDFILESVFYIPGLQMNTMFCSELDEN